MVTRKKSKSSEKKLEVKKESCVCGSCDHPNPGLPGYLLISLGLVLLPVTLGFLPEFEWVAKGWPLLVVMLGFVMIAKATICSIKSE